MTEVQFIQFVRSYSADLLSSKLGGQEFVLKIDEILAKIGRESSVVRFKLLQLLSDFQMDISLYVEDEEVRREFDGFYGLEELKQKVRDFQFQVTQCIAPSIKQAQPV